MVKSFNATCLGSTMVPKLLLQHTCICCSATASVQAERWQQLTAATKSCCVHFLSLNKAGNHQVSMTIHAEAEAALTNVTRVHVADPPMTHPWSLLKPFATLVEALILNPTMLIRVTKTGRQVLLRCFLYQAHGGGSATPLNPRRVQCLLTAQC